MLYSPELCSAVPLPHGLLFLSGGNVVLLCSWEYSLMLSFDWMIRPPSIFGFVVLEGIKPSLVRPRFVIQLPCIPTPRTSSRFSSHHLSSPQLRFPSTASRFITASKWWTLTPTFPGHLVVASCVVSMATDPNPAPMSMGSAS